MEQRRDPAIGMLCWDGTGITLSQLEVLPCNSMNPATFGFPLMHRRVPGANFRTVVECPDPGVLEASISAAQEMEAGGARAITTSCGFNAILQEELANAVSVPVFASSLLQVPMVWRMLRRDQAVGILTAQAPCLTPSHLEKVGADASIPVRIAGIGDTGEFAKVHGDPDAVLDGEKFIREIMDHAAGLIERHPEVGAFVLECTDLPPASAVIRERTGRPVFDIVTLINMVYEAVAGSGWDDPPGSRPMSLRVRHASRGEQN